MQDFLADFDKEKKFPKPLKLIAYLLFFYNIFGFLVIVWNYYLIPVYLHDIDHVAKNELDANLTALYLQYTKHLTTITVVGLLCCIGQLLGAFLQIKKQWRGVLLYVFCTMVGYCMYCYFLGWQYLFSHPVNSITAIITTILISISLGNRKKFTK